MYWHLHEQRAPWCRVFRSKKKAQSFRKYYSRGPLALQLYSSDIATSEACDYWEIQEHGVSMTPKGRNPAMTVTAIRLADGTDVAASDATCEGCGSSLADHNCGSAAGVTTSVTYSRSGKGTTRTPAAARPPCAHCGGKMHFNMSGTAVNAECIVRQFALDTGLMTDPNGRIPVLTIEMMHDVVAWADKLATPITYGAMTTAAGGAGTYAALRPKTGRKKKVTPAAPGSQIQDLADEEAALLLADEEPEEATKPKGKAKKSRKPKTMTIVNALADSEELNPVDLEEAVVETSNGHEAVVVAEALASPISAEEQARLDRAERRRLRKELLAGKR